ncbi:DUF6151 family protein [Hydrogenophaga sp.]|uniref:DUF6151 family protein n=1 Tax=Hydrogenophaga sp. TaxID=1904254 RepID=UPI003561D136
MHTPSTHPLACRCGALQGSVALIGSGNRLICYCRDCQAFARFLGQPDRVLDAQGGTEIVQTAPDRVRFSQGQEHLAVMRLSEKGMLRWYAACCRTPLGNTMSSRGVPFVGLVHSCLASAPLEPDFGPVRAWVSTASALGEPKPQERGMAGLMFRAVSALIGSRLSGRYKRTPFFSAANTPVAVPVTVSDEERRRLRLAPVA